MRDNQNASCATMLAATDSSAFSAGEIIDFYVDKIYEKFWKILEITEIFLWFQFFLPHGDTTAHYRDIARNMLRNVTSQSENYGDWVAGADFLLGIQTQISMIKWFYKKMKKYEKNGNFMKISNLLTA